MPHLFYFMEPLKHECGIALIRLLKPLEYYTAKYADSNYALSKLYLLMEKQHNRGQEGAGIASVSIRQTPGHEYMFRERATGKDAITTIFSAAINQQQHPSPDDPCTTAFSGELYMGHLRYSTTGKSGLKYIHPFLRRNNWRAKNLCICGNFNMTNIAEVFDFLTSQGQSPRMYSDSYITLELMGHRLDREVERCFIEAQEQGLTGKDITDYIDNHVLMENVLRTTMPHFDGGYVMSGITGSGEMFAVRDPHGIRPAFYYIDEEVCVIASERPVIQTTFDLRAEQVRELMPGQAIIINRAGHISFPQILEPLSFTACSFERIYFSRGNDQDIYLERKQLGHQLVPQVLNAVNNDAAHTVVSFIPNTAETAYMGLMEGMREKAPAVRTEKVVTKDIKLRTFITESDSRNDLAAHVYDVTMGAITPDEDYLVVIDDSIVRGTTLRESIIKILNRLHPKKMVIVSSAPQVRYPDFYGIDMSNFTEFIAFRACIALLHRSGQQALIDDVYHECKRMLSLPDTQLENPVRRLYKQFTPEELNEMMVDLLRPSGVTTPIQLVFQSIEGLHAAIPNHHGDWYFTGHYPTPGGIRLLCRSFIDFYENK